MDTDEQEIFQYLNGTEICRRAGGKRKFHEDPNWAKPILLRMEERGIIESDSQGRFRIKPAPRKKKHTQWVSPDIAKILAESGVAPDGEDGALAPDDFYDGL
jgi:hypothetical protein